METDSKTTKKDYKTLIIIVVTVTAFIGLGTISYIAYEFYKVSKAMEAISDLPDMSKGLSLPKELEANKTNGKEDNQAALEPVDWSQAINQLKENHFQFSKRVIEELNISQDSILTEGRVVPHMDSSTNKFEGIKVVSIKENGLLDLLKIKEGDVLSKINGQNLDNPMAMINSINELKGKNEIILKFNRESNDFNIRLTIVE